MKKLQLLILLGMFICSWQNTWSQVFAYPGATWMFHSPPFLGLCSSSYEKWEYTGDTLIGGENANKISVHTKWSYAWDSLIVNSINFNKYFRVSSDTVFIFNSADTSWVELYNFSLQIGDSTQSPLSNIMNSWSQTCPDSMPYQAKAVVVNTGISVIDGQLLRYYTLRYPTGIDTNHALQSYYERLITYDYWYPYDQYICGATDACAPPQLMCYKDNGMMTDSSCTDLSWFETLSIGEEKLYTGVKIYPNPASDLIIIETTQPETGSYYILTFEGKQVAYSPSNQVDVSRLSPGIYFVTNTNRTWYRKFIKQ